ncbi:uncharacterized protein DNG_01151 [Cephalotrichum gorgonifer]|uniref:Uncharacterized protein n=1 Tax=Cephalotrichum gorgonifer TaxID=2041049 RepID=A0AAE8MRC5_9PEZI|nr:uncharacterized protein DNG_01151 [Cephalotrichum gorgonifer]
MNCVSSSTECAISDTEREVLELQKRLEEARCRLKNLRPHDDDVAKSPLSPPSAPTDPSAHFLLLLSDSALPLGSFAFSSGLESFLAHTSGGLTARPPPPGHPFTTFLPESISSFASTNLPFALAAHDDPATLSELDDVLDAMTICTVGRRASTSQGRALLSLWEKSFANSIPPSDATAALKVFAGDVKSGSLHGHLSPAFGAVCRAVGMERGQMAYLLVMGHVKALVSAAVRSGVFGPYRAQGVLGGEAVRRAVREAVAREWDSSVEEAGQTVPTMDLWIGRHEVLYSRIFNS